MYNFSSVFNEYQLHITQKPADAAQFGSVVTRRQSPVLSKPELQRLILDMVG